MLRAGYPTLGGEIHLSSSRPAADTTRSPRMVSECLLARSMLKCITILWYVHVYVHYIYSQSIPCRRSRKSLLQMIWYWIHISAILALRLIGPLTSWDKIYTLVHKRLQVTRGCRGSINFFVTWNYKYETGSMTDILEHLIWESLKTHRRESRLILLYKGLMGKASIPTDDPPPPRRLVRRCSNRHSLAYYAPRPLLILTFTGVTSPPPDR